MTKKPYIDARPLIIYHAHCWDGFCAAWVARKRMGEIEAIAMEYGYKTRPATLGRHVWILDFSWSREELLDAARDAASLQVFDHHKTSAEALRGLSFCRFEPDMSGAAIAWDHWHAVDEPRPWLVDYTEDRDLWRHVLPFSQEVNAALRSYPLAFNVWDELAQRDPLSFVPEGQAIRRRERQIVEDHVRNASPCEMDGHKILAVNATVLYSEVADELAKDRPFGACYFDRRDGKRQWSLRSREGGIDVSEIAKAHGGGGHAQAAGFEE